jgi:hypothetical protein
MFPDLAASKVTAAHLSRRAVLYVRQSSLKQVMHNTDSAGRVWIVLPARLPGFDWIRA